MPTLRRYLSLCALLFWQGGFLFYAAVVIPIAGRVLGERLLHLRAEITGAATDWLNGAGVGVLALLLWDLASSVDGSRFRSRGRAACWAALFLTLAGLFALHYWMDVLDPPESRGPSNPVAFGVAHTLYVVVALLQTVAALVYLGLTVSAWRAEDARTRIQKEGSSEWRDGGEG
jgi:tetrahydromethanopterin S-methyltransferase subunit C